VLLLKALEQVVGEAAVASQLATAAAAKTSAAADTEVQHYTYCIFTVYKLLACAQQQLRCTFTAMIVLLLLLLEAACASLLLSLLAMPLLVRSKCTNYQQN
jgi:hypothetical protein